MIESRKTKDGLIYSYIEWYLVDEKGTHNNKGKFVWVNDLYVAPEFRSNGNIRTLSLMIREKIPWATHYYFKREKYKGRRKQHEIKKFLKE